MDGPKKESKKGFQKNIISNNYEGIVMNNIGVQVKNKPKAECDDVNCPYHGHLKIRGRIFTGNVVSDKMDKSIVVEWEYTKKLQKYQRFMRKKSSVIAHNPSCIHAKKGDIVRIAECKPISKTKTFVVIEKLSD